MAYSFVKKNSLGGATHHRSGTAAEQFFYPNRKGGNDEKNEWSVMKIVAIVAVVLVVVWFVFGGSAAEGFAGYAQRTLFKLNARDAHRDAVDTYTYSNALWTNN